MSQNRSNRPSRFEIVEFSRELVRDRDRRPLLVFVECVNLAQECRDLGVKVSRETLALAEKCTVQVIYFADGATEDQKRALAADLVLDEDLPFENPVGPAGIIELGPAPRGKTRWLLFGRSWVSTTPRRKKATRKTSSYETEEPMCFSERNGGDGNAGELNFDGC